MTAESIAAALGRYSRKSGGGFMACCPAHPDKNPSLAIDGSGGTLLVKCFAGCEQGDVIAALKSRGLWPGHENPLPPMRKPDKGEVWRPVVPVPNDAPPPPEAHPRQGRLSGVWRYCNAAGELLQLVFRFDPVGEKKQVIPLTYCRNGYRQGWRWQALPDPRPLYGLETLEDARRVVIVEGEKTADATRRLLGEIPVLTWPGGSSVAGKADWRPLAGKTVAIWPDADTPGIKAAIAVAKACLASGAEAVKIAEPPPNVAEGWDLADAEAEGWTREQVLERLRAGLSLEDFRGRHISNPCPAGESLTEDKSGGQNQEPEPPLLFDEINTPEISPALLPGWLGEYAEAVTRSTQTPPAMAVMLALSTVATCAAKRFEVAPHGEGYSEPLNLWTATALPPASRKTAVISAVTAPLVEWEKSESERLALEIKGAEIKRGIIEKRIKVLEAEAAKNPNATERDQMASDIRKLIDEMPREIIPPRLWTGDTTPERLQSLLADHGERMAVLTDEGGIFEVMAGLYSDGRANLDIFLQSHAGRAVRVDRQGRTAHLDAPALSFGLAIQPAILADFSTGGKKRFRGNGTLARFLYAAPRSNIGSRDVRATYQVPATVAARYRAGIFDLLAISPQMIGGREVPRRLTLTADALDSWQAFAEMIEKRQGTDGDLEAIQDWSGKLPGAALRVAGNFHLVEHGANPPAQIKAGTIEQALDLCALLIDHAKAAFAMMDADTATGDAKAVLKWITTGRLCRFKRGEAYRHFKGRFTGKTERLDKALRELQARIIVTEGTEPTGGRAATVFTVNPVLWGAE